MPNKVVYFLIDCSGSMAGPRADAVNYAMEKVVSEAIPAIRTQKNADLHLYFMAIGFSGDGVFTIMDRTSLDDFNNWDAISDAEFNGGTPTGQAILELIKDIQGVRGDPLPDSSAPAIILISDGEPNGNNPTYEEVLEYGNKNHPNYNIPFARALRVAIGINVDDNGRESLKKFGSLTSKMKEAGIESYYDCSENYVDKLVEVLKSATMHVSIGLNQQNQ